MYFGVCELGLSRLQLYGRLQKMTGKICRRFYGSLDSLRILQQDLSPILCNKWGTDDEQKTLKMYKNCFLKMFLWPTESSHNDT